MKYRQQLFTLALPAMAENILQILMGITDSYLVSVLGLVAISGVSVANNIMAVYQALFIALGAAVSSLVARQAHDDKSEESLQLQADSVSLTVMVSLVLGTLSLICGQSFLQFLGTTKAVSQAGSLYLGIVGGGSISLGLLTVLGAIHRAQGRPKLPMYVSLLTNLLNAILSALAVFLLKWGIAGIALGTVVSRLIGIVILGQQLPIASILSRLRVRINKELLFLALPTAGERLMMRAGDVAIIAIIVAFGTEVVAGNAIGETLTQFNYMPGIGMATAVLIMVASFKGEGRVDEVPRLLKVAYLWSTAMMLVVGELVYALGPILNPLFTHNQAAILASMTVMLFSFLGGPATAGTLLYTALWQGLGKAQLPFYATTIGMWGLRIFLGYFLGVVLSMGLAGVWLATIGDNIFRWCFLSYLYHRSLRQS